MEISINNNSANLYAGRGNRKPVTRPEQRETGWWRKEKVEPPMIRRWPGAAGLVMEKVTILRRGGSLDSKIKSETLKKKVTIGCHQYAEAWTRPGYGSEADQDRGSKRVRCLRRIGVLRCRHRRARFLFHLFRRSSSRRRLTTPPRGI
ncbi:hypothetical protein SESBI_08928 [Sesbania bispinosa]|nr:hypothetical protein SESBI_08928 [Sesbania bispinosa]